jgi:hypothetical protein
VGDDAWRLFRQILGRKYDLGFQSNLVSNMIAVADFAYIPLFLSHAAPPDYAVIV